MENQDQELFFKQLIHHYLKEQVEDLKGNKKEGSNSFIYLDSKTLNMLLLFLLLNKDKRTSSNEETPGESGQVPEELIEMLDNVIDSTREEFEGIISRLKSDK